MKNCYHCGLKIEEEVVFDGKSFCCHGCKSVYEILNQNKLQTFYELNENAGIRPDDKFSHQFDYLDSDAVFQKVVDFSEGGITLVTFKIPVIHCSSCVWLLESLQNLNKSILYSTVNFTKKTVQIAYNSEELKLSELAKFLAKLGYSPVINASIEEKKPEKVDNSLVIKLAVAGFCFGNVMLLAFPEYLESTNYWFEHYKDFFRWLMFMLSLPVVFYSATDYYNSAWYGIKNKILNIDIPLSLGIIVLFLRSTYEAYMDISSGYFDSLCGLLFFMLIGKYFQQRTYKALSFDRDYKSFYPIAVTRVEHNKQETVLISDLKVGDRILIKNQEIIPADGILIKGEAHIDNSFITGESRLIDKFPGDKIFAGGKQVGTMIEIELIKEVNQSYLNSLWNNKIYQKGEAHFETLTTKVSKYFTPIILLIAFAAAGYWYFIDISVAFQVLCAVLIVACPCALSLSSPFTFGNMLRIFGMKKFYLKDAISVERLAKINHVVFDKTGTLTHHEKTEISLEGTFQYYDFELIAALANQSSHPLSQQIKKYLKDYDGYDQVCDFEELPGQGLQGVIRGNVIRVGSAKFVEVLQTDDPTSTQVWVSINGEVKGKFVFRQKYREGLENMIQELKKSCEVSLLSGDNPSEEQNLKKLLGDIPMKFNQSPKDKVDYIQELQNQNRQVMMVGDGLNDAPALKQSNFGVALSESINNFTPSSDAILAGEKLHVMHLFILLARKSVQIVWWCFIISFAYNVFGLSFAIAGKLSPLFAAILMPISSISIVAFTSATTWGLYAKYLKKRA